MASLNGEPRACTKTERHEIERALILEGERLNSRSPDFRPDVGGILPGGELYDPWTFLHEIQLGKHYGHNPFLEDVRQKASEPDYRIPHPSWMSNYQCWREITDAQICEVFYYGENPQITRAPVRFTSIFLILNILLDV